MVAGPRPRLVTNPIPSTIGPFPIPLPIGPPIGHYSKRMPAPPVGTYFNPCTVRRQWVIKIRRSSYFKARGETHSGACAVFGQHCDRPQAGDQSRTTHSRLHDENIVPP